MTADVPFPDTPPGRLLKSWLESFNSGDIARHVKFVTEHSGSDMPKNVNPQQVAKRTARFREMAGGGFDLYKIEESSETKIRALLKEKGGFGWDEVSLTVDPAKPDLIGSIEFDYAQAPEEMRPVREDATALAKDVDQLATRLAAEDRFSGVILIAKDGKPLFQKAYGFADREQKIPNNLNTKFRIGSMNKMFTSVAIAQLVQQKKLKYSDTLAQVLPDYPDKDAAAKITVHQLLTHTSGLGDFFGEKFDSQKDNLHSLKDYLALFAGEKLKFEPGSQFSYSNAGMIVAGLIVERVSGQNYFDYVRDHIFKPAGMNDSGTFEKDKPQPNQSKGYMQDNGKWVSNYESLPMIGSSAGGGDSTAPDLLRFDQALRSHKLLSPELTSLITTGKVDVDMPGEKYAYGFEESNEDGKRIVGHGGGAPGMNCDLRMFWDSGYTTIVMSNFSPPIAQQLSGYIRQRLKQ
jgi:CubicO group peptidase (beta-lactamase class C family)